MMTEDELLEDVKYWKARADAAESKLGTIEELRKLAFELSPPAQYRLAFFIAENLGFVLIGSLAMESARELVALSPIGSFHTTPHWQEREKLMSQLRATLGSLEISDHCMGERPAHKVMTPEEYQAMSLQGWHEVCKNVDGFGGVGVRFVST
jgi:hypothetical protein